MGEQETSEDRRLTQVEAEERAALLEVRRYDIAVDLTDLLTGTDIRCVSTITFTSRDPGTPTFVDCAATVVSARLNGDDLPPPEQGRIALTGLAAENTLVVETVQPDTADGEGVHRSVDPADKEVYVWTSFEPDEARHVWACFDQPDLKAPHAFTVTAPETWRVVSNSGDPVVEEAQAPDGSPARRWTFPDTPPLSTYNPVVLAGPFHEIRREVDGHDLGLLTRRSLAALLDRDADELFTVTGQGLAFFGEVFAMPFPQTKYDQVFLPEFGGAMENYGCVAWSDAFLSRTSPTPAELDELAPGAAPRDGAHVVRQHRHDALVGRPVAQRGVRGVRLQLGDGPRHPLHRRVGDAPRRRRAVGLSRRPGTDVAPDPPADRRRGAGRCELRRHHLSQGGLGPRPADALRR